MAAKKLLQEVDNLEDDILSRLNTALKTNTQINAKHFPADFERQCKRVAVAMEKVFHGRYKAGSQNVRKIIAPTSAGTYYCYYLSFDKLKDDKNFVYDRYYLIMCQVMIEENIPAPGGGQRMVTHYVNLLDRADTGSRLTDRKSVV